MAVTAGPSTPAPARILVATSRGEGATNAPSTSPSPPSVAIRLPHPATGAPAAFLWCSGGGALHELTIYRPSHAAWFVGCRVVSDGGFWMATPVDPLLLLLPFLAEARRSSPAKPEGIFVSIAEALANDAYPMLEAIARDTEISGLRGP